MKTYKSTNFLPAASCVNRAIIFMLVLLVIGCKEKFDSPVPKVATGYLVVEGVINNEGDTTDIKISRTTNLGDTGKKYESGAIVNLESSNGNILQLVENAAGNYTINNLHLDTSFRYRVNIHTNSNEQYQSDFVAVRNNPPIDSINWTRDAAAVHIFINTNDPKNNTRYYQWEYNETWEFNTLYASLKYVLPNTDYVYVYYRDGSDPQIYRCWKYNASNTILLGSSAKLSEDIIHLPITMIPAANQKLSVLYSIMVKQFSWSKEGYEFLTRMKKNTESIGSVFDAQPSELNSNIHCTTNPHQPVVGFFNICTIREKRIFINSIELPGWNYKIPCIERVIANNPDSIKREGSGLLPTNPEKSGTSIITFFASEESCVDCRLTGTNVKPIYWP